MEPLVSIFQLQDADRSPLLTHIHQLHQEGKFKEVSVTPMYIGAGREGLRGQVCTWGQWSRQELG